MTVMFLCSIYVGTVYAEAYYTIDPNPSDVLIKDAATFIFCIVLLMFSFLNVRDNQSEWALGLAAWSGATVIAILFGASLIHLISIDYLSDWDVFLYTIWVISLTALSVYLGYDLLKSR